MGNQPFCSIIIPALNEGENLKESLNSLLNQSYPKDRYEIIVVDNGSTDQTLNIATKMADHAYVLKDVNVGAVRNYGASQSQGDILICTDADCVVDNDWLSNGVSLLLENKESVFGGGLKPRNNPSWVERYWLLNDDGNAIQQNDLMGSCIYCWKKDFDSVGGFDERVSSGEDSDISSRFKSLGLSVFLKGCLSVVHLGTPQTVKVFVKRQVWHSENYIKKIQASLSDKMFWLIILYLLSLILLFQSLFDSSSSLSYLLLSQVFPALLSVKRVKRSNYKNINMASFFKILVLDNLYLIGRVIGLLRGVKSMVLSKL